MQKSLYKDQKKKNNDPHLLDLAKDLENKLVIKENEVIKLKEKELEMKKQLYHLKKNKNNSDFSQPSRFNPSISQTSNKLSRLCSISINSPRNKINETKLEVIQENKKENKFFQRSSTTFNGSQNYSENVIKIQKINLEKEHTETIDLRILKVFKKL